MVSVARKLPQIIHLLQQKSYNHHGSGNVFWITLSSWTIYLVPGKDNIPRTSRHIDWIGLEDDRVKCQQQKYVNSRFEVKKNSFQVFESA